MELIAPNWLIFLGLFAPLTAVVGIEWLDKLYQYTDSPAADEQIKRTQFDEKKTKEKRKKDVKNDVENDVENGVNEDKKLCPIFGTLKVV